MNQLINIYNTLQDDESRMIFEKRLMYSISGNENYITDMLHKLIYSYGEDDTVYCLLRWLKERNNKEIVIFGAGCACRHIVQILGTYDVKVCYICDNNIDLHGGRVCGIEVISPIQLKHILKDVCIIVGVNWYSSEIYRQLSDMGARKEDIFVSRYGWWLGKEKQYFDNSIVRPGKHEVFIDGGAYTGEDSLNFVEWCHSGIYDYIYLFEPDVKNYEKCVENLKQYKDKIIIYNKGLWSCNDELVFSDNHKATSAIDNNGNAVIETTAIDHIFSQKSVSFIKMDIEGAEMEALKGAEGTIKENHPKLAICVYHKPWDIVDIPSYILNIASDYKFYLRHYSYTPSETVLYAV